MMKMHQKRRSRLVLVDDDRKYCAGVVERLGVDFGDQIDVVGVAHDGFSGFKLIAETVPDIAVIDVMLPVFDGNTLLETVKNTYSLQDIVCIMVTGFNKDKEIKRSIDSGAEFYFTKPYEINDFGTKIVSIYDRLSEKTDGISYFEKRSNPAPVAASDVFASEVLRKLGVVHSTKGCQFIRHGIKLCLEDNTHLLGVTKTLYPAIAKKFKTTPERVERSIRHTLGRAWVLGAGARTAGLNFLDARIRPSNSMFLRAVVDCYNDKPKTGNSDRLSSGRMI